MRVTDREMTRRTMGIRGRSHPIAMGLALVMMGGVAGCSRAEPEVVEEADVVVLAAGDVATAEEVTVSSGVALTGSLNPYQRVEVRAQVPGVVSELTAERG